MTILITGGAGFIGSALARHLKLGYPDNRIICFDNLSRRGSEFNVPILQQAQIEFIHGDVRNREDLDRLPEIHVMIECSAEPSVLAARENPAYSVNTNLVGALNCWELARKYQCRTIFLSTSRVYSTVCLNDPVELNIRESETRFDSEGHPNGINTTFPTDAPRSLYGGTKLAAEIILQEYAHAFKIPAIINRCGVVAGPGQFGKADQGVVTYWIKQHMKEEPVTYIGYQGKQVRDVLHIDDLCKLIEKQIMKMNSQDKGVVYNVGGGPDANTSLLELTDLCQQVTGIEVEQQFSIETRPDDVKWYISDIRKVSQEFGWAPCKEMIDIVNDTYHWLDKNKKLVKV